MLSAEEPFMQSAEYFRREAVRCHQLATESKDPEAAGRYRALARRYAAMADDLEESSPPAAPFSHDPMQQREQQQKKAEDEK
jgi:hypothetical protein